MSEVISAREAAELIRDGDTLAVSGFCGYGSPDEVLIAIRERFIKTGSPRNLTLFKGVSIGDKASRGGSYIALEGLIGKVICSHVGQEPPLAKLIADNKIYAYMLPLGTVTELFRAIAAHRPGVLTKCGMDTFADPRLEGSRANDLTREKGGDIVSLVNVAGEDCLFYSSFPVNVSVVRGTYADRRGNIVLDREALWSEQFEAAEAAHNSGGIVIAQVEDIVERDFDPRDVKLHHFMVDYIVKAKLENHVQNYDHPQFRPELCGEARTEESASAAPLPLDGRKVCSRRAALELKRGCLINLGIGMPEGVAAVAQEEGIRDGLTLSIESGVLGGTPLSGLALGGSVNPEAIYKMPDILNIYDGGGLDTAVLGLAETDRFGNVNVSKFGGRVTGPGGFIDISQNTKTVIFTGSFTAGGLETSFEGGRLKILSEGRRLKFRDRVEQVTFSGERALREKKRVLTVTERAVFELTERGPTLIEIAPGADLMRDILSKMEFAPAVSGNLKTMDERIFREGKMGIAQE